MAGWRLDGGDLDFRLGDVVTTVIRCARGEVIVLRHDTNLPRPCAR